MYRYSIMPLDMEHVDEICEDIRQQQAEGVADTALFIMYFSPEGTPPAHKAESYCRKYDVYRKKLDEMGLSHGVLVQSTLGHGPKPGAEHPFQKVESLTEDGKQYEICCPLDSSYRDYIREQMRVLAQHKPGCVMIDDDVGLLYRSCKGCACREHLKAFARKSGTELSREELLRHVLGKTDEDRRLRNAYISTQEEALVLAVAAMREGLDSVDPSIQGIVSTAGTFCEGQPMLAKIFAGKGNPVIVRFNNGAYCRMGTREFTRDMYRAAAQREILKEDVDVFLAETDTCPQNRYSTSASRLHAHMTGSILEGAAGAKHWITRLRAYEPESGAAYRRILAKYAGFYRTLEGLVPRLRPVGCRIPMPSIRNYQLDVPNIFGQVYSGWATCVLERLGLPLYFSGSRGGAVFLDELTADQFSDAELKNMLYGPVFLSAQAAEKLIRRGFGGELGVDVVPLEGERITREKLTVNGQCVSCQNHTMRIVPKAKNVRADSMVICAPDPDTEIVLFPGTTVCHNALGGTVTVFCGTPVAAFHYTQAFSFLCSSRKKQLIRLLKETDCLPVYYPGDEDMYMRAGTLPDGRLLCVLFNLSFDQIEECRMVCASPVHRVERLMPDGIWADCGFRTEGENVIVDTPLITLMPVVLALQ